MNGVKYSKNGAIIKSTINAAELKVMKLIWGGITMSAKVALKKQGKIVECFVNEDWLGVGINEFFTPSIQSRHINPKDLPTLNLPEGETKACVLILRTAGLKEETAERLEAFAEDLKSTMGLEFRVIMWN